MADQDKQTFPQIPATVWWGLREMFFQKVPSVVTDSYLTSQLNVQPVAARAYIAELRKLGLLDEDGRPTEVAKKWRMPETYREASDELLRSIYPEELLDVAPPEDGDRDKAVRWFMTAAGLGEGSAKNKAATYLMIGGAELPDETPKPRAAASKGDTQSKREKPSGGGEKDPNDPHNGLTASAPLPPLNVNIQIHISADATNEQIEAIFANMNKYLR